LVNLILESNTRNEASNLVLALGSQASISVKREVAVVGGLALNQGIHLGSAFLDGGSTIVCSAAEAGSIVLAVAKSIGSSPSNAHSIVG